MTNALSLGKEKAAGRSRPADEGRMLDLSRYLWTG
jgi:hypothetical protein